MALDGERIRNYARRLIAADPEALGSRHSQFIDSLIDYARRTSGKFGPLDDDEMQEILSIASEFWQTKRSVDPILSLLAQSGEGNLPAASQPRAGRTLTSGGGIFSDQNINEQSVYDILESNVSIAEKIEMLDNLRKLALTNPRRRNEEVKKRLDAFVKFVDVHLGRLRLEVTTSGMPSFLRMEIRKISLRIELQKQRINEIAKELGDERKQAENAKLFELTPDKYQNHLLKEQKYIEDELAILQEHFTLLTALASKPYTYGFKWLLFQWRQARTSFSLKKHSFWKPHIHALKTEEEIPFSLLIMLLSYYVIVLVASANLLQNVLKSNEKFTVVSVVCVGMIIFNSVMFLRRRKRESNQGGPPSAH